MFNLIKRTIQRVTRTTTSHSLVISQNSVILNYCNQLPTIYLATWVDDKGICH